MNDLDLWEFRIHILACLDNTHHPRDHLHATVVQKEIKAAARRQWQGYFCIEKQVKFFTLGQVLD
jgi:hypothetical protein